jgi:GNAT superfamily N-acetyltransferase
MCAQDKLQDDGISIRHFRPEDLDQIKVLFQQGMLPLMGPMIKLSMALKLKSLSWDNPVVMAAPLLALGWQSIAWTFTVPVYVGTVLALNLFWFLYFTFSSRQVFHGYVHHSLNSDLANIQSVYQTKGGCFLVATLNDDKVIGMVGGEFKEEETKDGTQRVYELRRMSVDPNIRGRGVGKRLIRRLEEDLEQLSKIFFTCSNIQYPAHALYKGQGFQFMKTETYPGAPKVFEIWHWEKLYGGITQG